MQMYFMKMHKKRVHVYSNLQARRTQSITAHKAQGRSFAFVVEACALVLAAWPFGEHEQWLTIPPQLLAQVEVAVRQVHSLVMIRSMRFMGMLVY